MTAAKNAVRGEFRDILTKGAKELVVGATPDVATLGLGAIAHNPLLNPASAAIATVAIGLTITALNQGYQTLQAHLQHHQDVKELFEQDYLHGTVSFFCPIKVTDRLNEQLFFDAYLGLLQDTKGKDSVLFKLAGIHFTEQVSGVGNKRNFMLQSQEVLGTRYALISMASLPLASEYDFSQGEDDLLDRARCGGDDFLGTSLPIFLEMIHSYEKQSNEQSLEMQSFPQQTVGRLDLVRFITIAFSNILLNLQHPPDLESESKMPLNDKAAIGLCAQVDEILDKILLPDDHHDAFHYIEKLYFRDEFLKFLRLLKREVQELREGYQYKLLRSLNLAGVVAESQGLLQNINASLFQMLYPNLSHRDQKYLRSLCRQISNALDDHPDVWTPVSRVIKKKLPNMDGLNANPSTVIDLIGVFSSVSPRDRSEIIRVLLSVKTLQNEPKFHALIEPLQQLDEMFIKPLEPFLPKATNVTGAYILNVLALTAESSPPFLQEAVIKTSNPTLQQQFAHINDQADWEEICRSILSRETGDKLQAMLKIQQGEFLGAVRTVKALQDFLDNSKHLLLNPQVQHMVKKACETLEQKRLLLSAAVSDLSEYVSMNDHDSASHRKKHIAHMMSPTKGLQNRFDALEDLIGQTLKVLKSSDFGSNQVHLIQDQVNAIYASYQEFEADKTVLLSLALAALGESDTPLSSHIQNHAVSGEFAEIGVQTDVLIDTPRPVIDDHQDLFLASLPPGHHLEAYVVSSSLLFAVIETVSAFLLMVALLVFLSLTFGAPYLPIIAALNAQQITACSLASYLSAASGGVGLALSYFFKPEPRRVNLSEDFVLEPGEEVQFEIVQR